MSHVPEPEQRARGLFCHELFGTPVCGVGEAVNLDLWDAGGICRRSPLKRDEPARTQAKIRLLDMCRTEPAVFSATARLLLVHLVDISVQNSNRGADDSPQVRAPPRAPSVRTGVPGMCGLSNPTRFTCYANCVLQQLYRVPHFVNAVMVSYMGDMGTVATGANKTRVSNALGLLFAEMRWGDACCGDAAGVVSSLGRVCGQGAYDMATQQDASRFAVDLLSTLGAECSAVDECFGGTVTRTTTTHPSSSSSGQATARKRRSCRFVTLPVECRHDCLQDALDARWAPQRVPTREGVTIIQEELEHPPLHVWVQLKRFELDPAQRQPRKLTNELPVPPTVELGGQIYRLGGVVMHEGEATDGHYTSYVRDAAGLWVHADDAKLQVVSEKSVLDSASGRGSGGRSAALMLIYDAPYATTATVPKSLSTSGSTPAPITSLRNRVARQNATHWTARFGADVVFGSFLRDFCGMPGHSLEDVEAMLRLVFLLGDSAVCNRLGWPMADMQACAVQLVMSVHDLLRTRDADGRRRYHHHHHHHHHHQDEACELSVLLLLRSPIMLVTAARLGCERGVWRKLKPFFALLVAEDTNGGCISLLVTVLDHMLKKWLLDAEKEDKDKEKNEWPWPLRVVLVADTCGSESLVCALLDCVQKQVVALCKQVGTPQPGPTALHGAARCAYAFLAAMPRLWKHAPNTRPWFVNSAGGVLTELTEPYFGAKVSKSMPPPQILYGLFLSMQQCVHTRGSESGLSDSTAPLPPTPGCVIAQRFAYDSDDDEGDGMGLPVGTRVDIEWANGKAYSATVEGFAPERGTRGKHLVRYDDGEHKYYDMLAKFNWCKL